MALVPGTQQKAASVVPLNLGLRPGMVRALRDIDSRFHKGYPSEQVPFKVHLKVVYNCLAPQFVKVVFL